MKTQTQIRTELNKVQKLLFADKMTCASGLYGSQQALAWALDEHCGAPSAVAKRGSLYSPKDRSNAKVSSGDEPR